MARFRDIDPLMRSTPLLDGASLLARLVLVYLMSDADDEGRLLGDPTSVLVTCFPRALPAGVTKGKLAAAVAELVERGFLVAYTANDQQYLAIRGWRDGMSLTYQVIDKRIPSRMPPPPPGSCPDRPAGRGRRPVVRGQREVDDSSSSSRLGVAADVDVDRTGRGREADADADRTGTRESPLPSPAEAGSGDSRTTNANGAAAPGAAAMRLSVLRTGLRTADERIPLIDALLAVPVGERDAGWLTRANAIAPAPAPGGAA